MEEPNFSYLKSFSGGDKVFEEKILDIIKMEYPHEREAYLRNIAVHNFGLAANNVHKIRHKISLLGLEKSQGMASQHELNLIKGNNTLHENFNDILNTMARFLNEL